MARRQREWAKRARLALIQALGAWCRKCGSTGAEGEPPLTIEHLYGREWIHRQVDHSWRISIYRREAAEGLLTVLCASCNPRYGQQHRGRPKRRVLVRTRQPNGTTQAYKQA